ncbi:MAG TPA: leucine/isoleucine/valine transporter permease subunit [Thermodesulfobacteriota bacterium]|nr:leucine/isoleucine/valine transporter permease subunit [Thermodesulfobacteriota bacterium]
MKKSSSLWRQGIKIGLIGGTIGVLLALVGMVEAFTQLYIISDAISMGQTLLLAVAMVAGYLAAKRANRSEPLWVLVNSLVSGLIVGGLMSLLVAVGNMVRLRAVFINASPDLFKLLTFNQGIGTGILLLLIFGTLSSSLSGLLFLCPSLLRRVLIRSLGGVAMAGLLQDLLRAIFAPWGMIAEINQWFFPVNGLTAQGAVSLFTLISATSYFWMKSGNTMKTSLQRLPPTSQRVLRITSSFFLVVILLALPQILGLFLSEVLTIVGLFVLLGLGLNIVVGFAGLLDLGYVAFFAIGAYTVAVLTSPELGFLNLTFWEALPFAVITGVVSGILLGIPVLKMRGDYLAIATLGFGEIIRILVLSDFLRPWLGGAQGIAKIPKPSIGSIEFATPQQIYYLILAGCLLAGFISWRLRDSRLGRAWMAVREDEDVAQAMGINLVAAKLLAFATGAGFSALSGAIFASKLGSVYPHSFSVMISINILCLIIVGGMGSIPGVIVGAIALVGLPELLREFAEYRLLVYGAALVAMMILRPEGLWPEAKRRQELHREEAPEIESA